MDETSPRGVTALLLDWSAGDVGAPARLMPLVKADYDAAEQIYRQVMPKLRAGNQQGNINPLLLQSDKAPPL